MPKGENILLTGEYSLVNPEVIEDGERKIEAERVKHHRAIDKNFYSIYRTAYIRTAPNRLSLRKHPLPQIQNTALCADNFSSLRCTNLPQMRNQVRTLYRFLKPSRYRWILPTRVVAAHGSLVMFLKTRSMVPQSRRPWVLNALL